MRSIFSYRLLCLGIALAAVLQVPSLCRASSVGILVPAYFYPGSGGPNGVGDGWAAMAAAAGKAPITAIVNPDSGPLPGPADPNYVGAMTQLEQAGGKVIAYVDTAYGALPLSTVENNISLYIGQYGKLIDGIFLDDVNVLPGTLSYYAALNTYVKGLNPSYLLASNPGQPFLNGVTPADYLSVADVIDIFEGPDKAAAPGDAGFNNYPYGLNWFLKYPNSHFENIVFDVPDAANMSSDLQRAEQLNAGQIYITDQGANGGNPYGQLPSYWNQEVADVASSTPEPASSTMLLLGGVLGSIALRNKRRRLRRDDRQEARIPNGARQHGSAT